MGCSSSSPASNDDGRRPPASGGAGGADAALLGAASPPSHNRLKRGMSSASNLVAEELDDLELEFKAMMEMSDAAARDLGAGEMPKTLRSELAQLHGTANKMLATRVDSLLTGDLTSGKDEARARRKALVAGLEALIERTEQQVSFLDLKKAGGTPEEDLRRLLALPAAPTHTPGKAADDDGGGGGGGSPEEVNVAFPTAPASAVKGGGGGAPVFPDAPTS